MIYSVVNSTFKKKLATLNYLNKISIGIIVLPGKLSLDWLLSRLDSDEIGGNLGATVATSGRRIPRSMSSSLVARTEIFRSRPEKIRKGRVNLVTKAACSGWGKVNKSIKYFGKFFLYHHQR